MFRVPFSDCLYCCNISGEAEFLLQRFEDATFHTRSKCKADGCGQSWSRWYTDNGKTILSDNLFSPEFLKKESFWFIEFFYNPPTPQRHYFLTLNRILKYSCSFIEVKMP